MTLVAYAPQPPLGHYVETLWYCEDYRAPHRRERVLPIPRFQLIIDLTGRPSIVCGIRSNSVVIDTSAIKSVIGAVFRPGAARRFLDAPADEFHNLTVSLDQLWGGAYVDLRDRLAEAPTPAEKCALLERALTHLADDHVVIHPAVLTGLGEFGRRPHIQRVLDVTKDVGLSRRRFAQLFREQVGLTPKLYCRLLRFRRVLGHLQAGGEVDWAAVAVAGGYCDQAHFSHEFRDFSGMSPGTYLASDRPSASHVAVD